MKKRNQTLAAIIMLIFAVTIQSCKETKKEDKNIEGENDTTVSNNNSSSTQPSETSNMAICILDGLSVREEPKKNGKWMTRMSLGEKVEFTGEKVMDSTSKREFYSIKLIDGTEGWTQGRFMVIGGKVGVLLEDTFVYRRPDLLTKTDKMYSKMDVIAIQKTQDEWFHVKGKRSKGEYIEEGWIKSSNISSTDVDIATAKFALNAINKPSMAEKIEALNKVVNNPDLSSSKFLDYLKERIADYQSRNNVIDTAPVENAEEAF